MRPRHHRFTILILLLLLSGCAWIGKPRADADRGKRYVSEAKEFLEHGQIDSALAAFGLALEENPNLTDAHMGMGEIFRDRGDHNMAIRSYERAASIDPANFDAQYYLGLMRQLLGKIQDAINAYLRALAIDPDSVEAIRDIASAYLQLGRSAEALPYAERASELDPDSQHVWYNLAATYSLLGRYEKAVDAYRQAAELGDLADPVLLGLADAHLRLGNYQRAINVLRSLLHRTPTPTAHERMGYALFKLRELGESLENYNSALKLDPDDAAALNGTGACLMTLYLQDDRTNTNLRDDAVWAWRRSIQIRPGQQRIVDLLSRYGRL